MGGVDRDEDRTFAVNFSANGVAKLRTTVMDKLKEFMGDYTDDTLVEYVVVLLKNGRRKEEARNELNVFLGEDSDSFVTWLWDHLQSNVEQYVQPQVSLPDSSAKTEPINWEQGGRNDFRHVHDNDKVVSEKLSRRKHTREWKDPVKKVDEPHPLRSSVIERVHEETTQFRDTHAKRSVSPRPATQKKRNRPDEKIETKRERTVTDAPRRLLQFAVRDAVTTPRSSQPSAEPVLKRLRSVVSASAGDSTHEVSPRKTRVVGAGSNVMAIKAVEEAAKDVIKKRSSGNVFDRLGRSTDIPQQHNQIQDYKKSVVGIEGDSYLLRNRHNGESVENTMLESDTAMAYYESKYYDGFNNVNDSPQTGIYAEKEDGSLGVQYSITRNADGVLMKPRKIQDQPAPVASALTNTSVNLNTWEQTHYAQQNLGLDMDNKKPAPRGGVYVSKSADKLKDNNASLIAAGNGNVKPVAAITQKVSQKPPTTASPGIYAAGRPTEDADSRTVFVSNVHFAATKDALSRHFNKFGEVLKVIIVTDAATGQPKGSAYVEFMRKESAENALSLDGTSFMSRILKIVRKGGLGQQEASPMMSWASARGGGSSSSAAFGGSRFLPRGGAGAFQRGGSSSYNRSWTPVKAGARSMQWKRDDSTTTTTSNDNNTSSVATHIGRSLTYVRNTTDQAEGNNHPSTTATTTT
ncbi:uncharacterized protein LOC124917595 [Impatiens glandulifera]|uniref:uncharacterized protein LOC124917595 n=1 Tax=Impatiens glandulifera TaxID=253017 RepID=UPI001FB08A3B|nr:uncharacterized protein LOC124917595 [Impatiens glandulifera]